MKFGKRLAVIALFPLLSLIVVLLGHEVLPTLLEEAAYRLSSSHRFVGFVVAAYILNYVIAWKWAASFSVSMTRMLIWGVVAYLSLSNAVDVFLNNRDMFGQVLFGSEVTDKILVSELRHRLAAYVAALAMACVCIGIGFEKKEESD